MLILHVYTFTAEIDFVVDQLLLIVDTVQMPVNNCLKLSFLNKTEKN